MKRYQVNGQSIVLYSGAVSLTRAQAEPRLGRLEGHMLAKAHQKVNVKSDLRATYGVAGEVHFKVGEVLGYDGDVPKQWADVLLDLDAMEAEALENAEATARSNAERAANELAARQHDELVAAMVGITGDDNANIALDQLVKLLAGRINFDPTPEQLERAWAAHVA